MMRRRAVVFALAVALTGVAPGAATAQTPGVLFNCADYPANQTVTRSAALIRSQTWLDAKVPYNQGACHKNGHGDYRTDCSGYLSMIWGLKRSYTTWELPSVATEIARADLRPGDALNIPHDHTAMFVRWADAAHTRPVVREQAGPDYSPTAERVWSEKTAARYTPLRYNNIKDDGGDDVDGDGLADIVGVIGGKLRYYHGDGTGNFHFGSEAGEGWESLSHLETADVNGDARADLVGVKDGELRYYRGDGTGNFHGGDVVGTGWGGYGHIALGDVNGDDKADIVAVGDDKLHYFYGDGTGNFHAHSSGGSDWGRLTRFEVGDISGDGKADILGVVDGRLRYYTGDGTGNFHWGHEIGEGWDRFGHLALGDVNGDRKADVVGVADDKLHYFYGDGTGNFHPHSAGGKDWNALTRFASS